MSIDKTTIPKHIAIIMDGNRRWAKARGLEIMMGHQKVVDDLIEPLTDRCIELGIPYLSLWAFSTENWGRDQKELEGLMRIFRSVLTRKVDELNKKGVRMNILGDIDRFPKDIAEQAKQWVEVSKQNSKITVNFALNYGGRSEIIRAIHKAKQQLGDAFDALTEEQFGQYLDTSGMPDPDLIIRPGGQQRLSGFMPWQGVYSELYFSELLMPEFGVQQLDEAIEEFQSRQRRFGK